MDDLDELEEDLEMEYEDLFSTLPQDVQDMIDESYDDELPIMANTTAQTQNQNDNKNKKGKKIKNPII